MDTAVASPETDAPAAEENPVDAALAAAAAGQPPPSEQHTEEPILDVSALEPERPRILIRTKDRPEGELYELAVMSDFGIEEQQRLTQEGKEFDRLWGVENASQTDLLRLKQLLDAMFERILRAPDEIKDLVKDAHRSQIVMAFTLAPLAAAAARAKAKEEEEAARSRTTENSSPDSTASMDEPPEPTATG